MNADGTLQVATAATGVNSISILRSNNDGTFRGPSNFTTTAGPTAVAVADFNNDGALDLATASPAANIVSVLLQTPQAAASTTSVNFGAVAAGGSAVQTVTITNTGSAPLNIKGVTAAAPFSQVNDCPASLIAGNLCTITVTFSPATAGVQSGTLTVSGNVPGTPLTVSLTGTGVGVVAVTLSQKTITGGSTFASNSVSLTSPAPVGGAAVTLASSDPAVAAVPDSVTIAQGSSVSQPFSIATTAVTSSTQVTITATYAGVTASATLSVTPMPAAGSVTLSPNSIAGAR